METTSPAISMRTERRLAVWVVENGVEVRFPLFELPSVDTPEMSEDALSEALPSELYPSALTTPPPLSDGALLGACCFDLVDGLSFLGLLRVLIFDLVKEETGISEVVSDETVFPPGTMATSSTSIVSRY